MYITTILLLSLAGLIIAVMLSRRRHRCVHNDPLCRRERPCIACYRQLFEGVEFVEPPKSGGLGRRRKL